MLKIEVCLSLDHEEFNVLRKFLGNTTISITEKAGMTLEEDIKLTEIYKKMMSGLRQLEIGET